MALLSISKQNSSPQPIENENSKSLCKIHSKEVEGYCEDDEVLLCIDCILIGGHKSHNINSINKVYENELTNLPKSVRRVLNLQGLLNTMI